ncbi:UNVERIFIED_CONTAM: hypothetical protein HDU68_007559 [Siphonaria sp. JEL0065]|nr:hypothetical protein HDU68_007559 [Siphonaria sp. JEL0065]
MATTGNKTGTTTEGRVASGQDLKTDGWKKDAHKNLPGFQVLYETFPNADWYFMIDDDTYMLFENMREYLTNLDSEEPYFTGRNNYYKGCDGVTEFNKKGPFIAQGGSGIVISRGAMKLMIAGMDQCILKYQDCWAGDIRTALCLRDVGVLIKWGNGFNSHSPVVDIEYPQDPCALPNAFHHVLPHQMQQLYDLEMKNKQRNNDRTTNMGEIYASFHNKSSSIIENATTRAGRDYKIVTKTPNVTACQDYCKSEKECVSWNYDGIGHVCNLKKFPALGTPAVGFSSGVIVGLGPFELDQIGADDVELTGEQLLRDGMVAVRGIVVEARPGGGEEHVKGQILELKAWKSMLIKRPRIVISPGGMQAMVKIVAQCIVKHPGWADDIRIGLNRISCDAF